jgi:glycosyltransferase involved in cell wall biosynthesis
MEKVSVIIPSCKERFLPHTIADVINKAVGPIEVLAVLDGYMPDTEIVPDPRLIIIHKPVREGMRAAINSAAAQATGKYLMKCDAHCMFAEGYDAVLQADCDDNWVVIPRRVSLDAETWSIKHTGKIPVDAHFLSWPYAKYPEVGMHGNVWNERARQRKDVLIDDEMSTQGSCWFMTKKHFDFLGGFSEQGYGTFVQEAQEFGNKTWLSGGRMVVNKKTWYAHLHKGKEYGRGYFISKGEMIRGAHYSADYWMNNRWTERKFDLKYLIDKFWPVPGWPTDWQEQQEAWNKKMGKATV